MIAGLGKDGQIVSISQNRGLVFVRMGEAPSSGSSEVTTLFCNQIWQKINNLDCTLNVNIHSFNKVGLEPNPAKNIISISNIESEKYTIEIFDMIGKSILRISNQNNIDISNLASSMYIVKIQQGNQIQTQKFFKK
jgi:hypothetical protein